MAQAKRVIIDTWSLPAKPKSITDHIQAALSAAYQIQAQIDNLTEERDQARMSTAVAHGALDTLISAIQEDPGAGYLTAGTITALDEARETCEPEKWERLLEQIQIMHRALAEIGRVATGRTPLIAQSALEDISQ